MITHPVEPPTEVTPRLWVGGQLTPDALDLIRAAGATHVLNVATEPDDYALTQGLRVSWAPVVDDLEPKAPSWFQRSVSFARAALAVPGRVLYVHCSAGVHRGPLMAYAILRAVDGMRADEALQRIQRARRSAQFPPVYLRSAETYLASADADSGRAGPAPPDRS